MPPKGFQAVRQPTRKSAEAQPLSVRFNFLFDAARSLTSCPLLAAHLGRSALKVADEPGVVVPRRNALQLCERCGVTLVPECCTSALLRRPRLSSNSQPASQALQSFNHKPLPAQGTTSLIVAVLVRTCKLCTHENQQPFSSENAAQQAATAETLAIHAVNAKLREDSGRQPAAANKASPLAATNQNSMRITAATAFVHAAAAAATPAVVQPPAVAAAGAAAATAAAVAAATKSQSLASPLAHPFCTQAVLETQQASVLPSLHEHHTEPPLQSQEPEFPPQEEHVVSSTITHQLAALPPPPQQPQQQQSTLRYKSTQAAPNPSGTEALSHVGDIYSTMVSLSSAGDASITQNTHNAHTNSPHTTSSSAAAAAPSLHQQQPISHQGAELNSVTTSHIILTSTAASSRAPLVESIDVLSDQTPQLINTSQPPPSPQTNILVAPTPGFPAPGVVRGTFASVDSTWALPPSSGVPLDAPVPEQSGMPACVPVVGDLCQTLQLKLVVQLRAELKALGMPTSGNKIDLVQRLAVKLEQHQLEQNQERQKEVQLRQQDEVQQGVQGLHKQGHDLEATTVEINQQQSQQQQEQQHHLLLQRPEDVVGPESEMLLQHEPEVTACATNVLQSESTDIPSSSPHSASKSQPIQLLPDGSMPGSTLITTDTAGQAESKDHTLGGQDGTNIHSASDQGMVQTDVQEAELAAAAVNTTAAEEQKSVTRQAAEQQVVEAVAAAAAAVARAAEKHKASQQALHSELAEAQGNQAAMALQEAAAQQTEPALHAEQQALAEREAVALKQAVVESQAAAVRHAEALERVARQAEEEDRAASERLVIAIKAEEDRKAEEQSALRQSALRQAAEEAEKAAAVQLARSLQEAAAQKHTLEADQAEVLQRSGHAAATEAAEAAAAVEATAAAAASAESAAAKATTLPADAHPRPLMSTTAAAGHTASGSLPVVPAPDSSHPLGSSGTGTSGLESQPSNVTWKQIRRQRKNVERQQVQDDSPFHQTEGASAPLQSQEELSSTAIFRIPLAQPTLPHPKRFKLSTSSIGQHDESLLQLLHMRMLPTDFFLEEADEPTSSPSERPPINTGAPVVAAAPSPTHPHPTKAPNNTQVSRRQTASVKASRRNGLKLPEPHSTPYNECSSAAVVSTRIVLEPMFMRGLLGLRPGIPVKDPRYQAHHPFAVRGRLRRGAELFHMRAKRARK